MNVAKARVNHRAFCAPALIERPEYIPGGKRRARRLRARRLGVRALPTEKRIRCLRILNGRPINNSAPNMRPRGISSKAAYVGRPQDWETRSAVKIALGKLS